MKILLDIPDKKAASLLEVLSSISYVKAERVSPEKALLIKELKEAVDNLNLVKSGKLKAQPAREVLNEL
jgi:polyhydroxyalkanoate synthesis regulator phasin